MREGLAALACRPDMLLVGVAGRVVVEWLMWLIFPGERAFWGYRVS